MPKKNIRTMKSYISTYLTEEEKSLVKDAEDYSKKQMKVQLKRQGIIETGNNDLLVEYRMNYIKISSDN